MFKYLIVVSVFFVLSKGQASHEEKEARKPASIGTELLQQIVKTADLYSQARVSDLTCELDAYQSEIINLLKKAQYREGFTPDMITNNIRTALAGTIALKEFTGEVNLEANASKEEYEKALTGTYFEMPGSGAYGPQETFWLKKDGVAEFSILVVSDTEPFTSTKKIAGNWGVKVEKGLVRIWFTQGKRKRVYRLEKSYDIYTNGWILKTKEKASDEGKRRVHDEGNPRVRYYNGIVSECEA